MIDLKTVFTSVIFSLLFISSTYAGNCNNFKLQILGAGGPEINDGLASSSYLVWINNKARILIDAGGGSSSNFEKSGAKFNDLYAVLLSHLHVDHSAALPIYLKAGYFTNRNSNLALFGPTAGGDFPSTTEFLSALISDKQKSVYPYLSDNLFQKPTTDFLIIPKSIIAKDVIWSQKLTSDITIKSISVHHGSIPALAWRVDYNHCSITFSGDMNGSSNNLQKLANNTNILVAHNAIPENAFSVAKRLHMTPSKIGQIAKEAEVKKLILSHFMLRTINTKNETKTLIRKMYQGDIIEAQALMIIDVN